MKFPIKDFFSKCDQIRRKLRKFTEEILNEKLHFLSSVGRAQHEAKIVREQEKIIVNII